MTKLNDPIAFEAFCLVATRIVRHGIEYFAVVRVTDSNKAYVLRTATSEGYILTMLHAEAYKASHNNITSQPESELEDEDIAGYME